MEPFVFVWYMVTVRQKCSNCFFLFLLHLLMCISGRSECHILWVCSIKCPITILPNKKKNKMEIFVLNRYRWFLGDCYFTYNTSLLGSCNSIFLPQFSILFSETASRWHLMLLCQYIQAIMAHCWLPSGASNPVTLTIWTPKFTEVSFE